MLMGTRGGASRRGGGSSTAFDGTGQSRPGALPGAPGLGEGGLAGPAPTPHEGSFVGGVVIDYALGNHGQPTHSMSSRTLFGLILLLAIAAAGPPSDAQQATRIPKIGFLGSA